MAADVVQARYAELDEVAQRFNQLANDNAQLVQRVNGTFAKTRLGHQPSRRWQVSRRQRKITAAAGDRARRATRRRGD
ncbi:MAG TPA: hypothetical protein VKQ30_20105 [Ktedonobacterales bacterium]|nr:hypothetical protein [Ktedonobacterales bacterium]